jgi:hypothetical protein
MTPQQWETIERSLDGLSVQDRLELVEHIVRSIRVGDATSQDRTRQRRENLGRLRTGLAALPVAEPPDGLTNRDHDRILYGTGS